MTIACAHGMSRHTGVLLAPDEHLRQSIRDILLTPIGSRLMRREYGSLLPFLVDMPANHATRLKMMSSIATAIIKYEPRVTINQVQIAMNANATNQTGNTGWDITIDLKTQMGERFSTSLSLVAGAL